MCACSRKLCQRKTPATDSRFRSLFLPGRIDEISCGQRTVKSYTQKEGFASFHRQTIDMKALEGGGEVSYHLGPTVDKVLTARKLRRVGNCYVWLSLVDNSVPFRHVSI